MAKAFRLHDYQSEIVARLHEAWKSHRAVMVQMPTGTGKTHVLASLVNEELRTNGRRPKGKPIKNEEFRLSAKRVWIIAHRRELVVQIEETIRKMFAATLNSSFFVLHSSFIKVLSIQWISRHIDEIGEQPGLVIIDEAHHALAETYRMLWERCPQARFLGLTATPCRMNGRGFTDLFGTLVTSWSIAEFIERGYLSLFDYVAIRPDSETQRLVDSLEKRGADGDYQVKEMESVLNRGTSIGQLYESMERFAEGKKGIVYAISIDHARRIAEYYSGQGVKATAIDSRTPATERKRLVEEFRAGKIEVLVNVDVFSEGFDCPDVEFVQMARPTLSLSKYLQQVGRGLRKSEGKEACVLIDNVGLYRVFGLPTVSWDWEAMFRGKMAGKGIRSDKRRDVTVQAALREESDKEESGKEEEAMEVIVEHGQLLSMLAGQESQTPVMSRKFSELKAWQDEETGLWGLRRGREKVTEARYVTVFDIRYDTVAVRFTDKRCGLVNASGETLWEKRQCRSMRFAKDRFLTVRTTEGREWYVDLYNLQMYESRPEVMRYGDIELLKVGSTCYSRTRNRYENSQEVRGDDVSDRRFYVAVFDYKVPASCCIENTHTDGYRWGYACILKDDYESFYWIYRRMEDGSIVVTDDAGRYYHVEEGRKKRYIGCRDSAEERERCLSEIERIAGEARKRCRLMDAEKREQRLQILNRTDEAVPFRSGMKWGLKVGNRITVPPIYRNIKSPVGKYCAVEKSYSQWGVIALDGTIMVTPQYSDIEINVHGGVTGTKVTGNKIHLKLP